jgi:hypothetical protein
MYKVLFRNGSSVLFRPSIKNIQKLSTFAFPSAVQMSLQWRHYHDAPFRWSNSAHRVLEEALLRASIRRAYYAAESLSNLYDAERAANLSG